MQKPDPAEQANINEKLQGLLEIAQKLAKSAAPGGAEAPAAESGFPDKHPRRASPARDGHS
eukprot:11926170-Alexandrium_andersonii.AAC.1